MIAVTTFERIAIYSSIVLFLVAVIAVGLWLWDEYEAGLEAQRQRASEAQRRKEALIRARNNDHLELLGKYRAAMYAMQAFARYSQTNRRPSRR